MNQMKKYVAICATLVALAWVGVAAAATPQGKLTGSASYGVNLTIVTPIIDGGTSYVGLENDKSGNCDGDSGVITIGRTAMNVPCAHYVASSRDGAGAKMRFAYQQGSGYIPARITDSASGDTFKIDLPAAEVTLAQAQAWVNLGLVGSGSSPTFAWQLLSMTSSTFSITP